MDKETIIIATGELLFTAGMILLSISSLVSISIQLYFFIDNLRRVYDPIEICGIFLLVSLVIVGIALIFRKIGEKLIKDNVRKRINRE